MRLEQLVVDIIDKYEEISLKDEEEGNRTSMHTLLKIMSFGLWAERENGYRNL